MIKKFIFLSIISINYFSLGASESKVYFINLKDGDIVENPIFIQFGLSGKGVAPAGVNNENTGHHHLLIDVKVIDLSKPIPSSKNHLHFGGGQTETSIELINGSGYKPKKIIGITKLKRIKISNFFKSIIDFNSLFIISPKIILL